jgi:hypothetical protein
MQRFIAITLLTLSTIPASFLFIQPASAETQTVCYPVPKTRVIQNPADHANAYAEGYSEGRQEARRGKTYKPRSAGGEFGRGFDDGYYNRPFTGQQYAVPDKVEHYTAQECHNYTVTEKLDRDEVRYRINQIYREELGREADAGGMRDYQRAYENGWSLDRIRRAIENSSEAKNRRGR